VSTASRPPGATVDPRTLVLDEDEAVVLEPVVTGRRRTGAGR
jgi:hypothetical protein